MSRVLALDPGSRRIGVALSDPLRIAAHPFAVLDAGDDDLMGQIRDLAAEQEVAEIVVGLPIGLRGGEGPAAEAAREFAARVAEATGLPVVLQDERFSTVTAERVLLEAGVRRDKRKQARDRVAAAVFLQAYLDAAP